MSISSAARDAIFSSGTSDTDFGDFAVPIPVPSAETAEDRNLQGMARYREGDPHGALAQFIASVQLDPHFAEAWNNCGVVYLSQHLWADAVQAFDRALRLAPAYAEALNNRGRARQLLGDSDGARADFDEAIVHAAGSFLATVHHNRGTLSHSLGDLQDALADFDRALEIDADHVATYVNRGAVRKELSDLAGAMADFDYALAATPPADAAPILHARGGVRVLVNDFKGAVADYDAALRIDPGLAAAYVSRGNARYHLRDARGLIDYLAAFRIDARSAAVELLRILRLGLERGIDEILDNCDRHLRIDDRDLLAHARRGLSLALLGRDDEAGPHLRMLSAVTPEIAAVVRQVLDIARSGEPIR